MKFTRLYYKIGGNLFVQNEGEYVIMKGTEQVAAANISFSQQYASEQ